MSRRHSSHCTRAPGNRLRRAWMAGALLLAVLVAPFAAGNVVPVDQPPTGPLGQAAQVLVETGAPMDLEAARARLAEGHFRPGDREVPDFGIGARPAWLHLAFDNPTGAPLARTLVAGTTWIDHLDVYLVRDGAVVARWQAGDAAATLHRPEPGTGYVFVHDFAPGRTELFLRASTPDPLSLPVYVMTPDDHASITRWRQYAYGFLYGFLVALVAYNALLFAGMRERSNLDYAIYLGAFVLMNIAYTGHGYDALWPGENGLQRFVIMVMMILFCCAGLRFSSGFLNLDEHLPRIARAIRIYSHAGIAVLFLAIVTGQQAFAAQFAFMYLLTYTVSVFALGIYGVQNRLDGAGYFLAAVAWGLAGGATTTLGVWGFLPYNAITFHAVEICMATEAALLALAVAHRVRVLQRARELAEHLVRIDALTGLPNRRAFTEQAGTLWHEAIRHKRPLSLIVLDLDHFKSVNDIHGRLAGDLALKHVAALLGDCCRRGDLLARWGGEEFILMLPGTSLAQALGLAERIRKQVAASEYSANGRRVILSASLGVTAQDRQASLEALLGEADAWLLRAKKGGRDRVAGPWTAGDAAKA